jgi:integrase
MFWCNCEVIERCGGSTPGMVDTRRCTRLGDRVHGLREARRRQKKDILDAQLWPWSRVTAWRQVCAVMITAGIPNGPHRCPKGLRDGFAMHALSKGVPLHMVSQWMGHATMDTTAISCNAVGEEQQSMATSI